MLDITSAFTQFNEDDVYSYSAKINISNNVCLQVSFEMLLNSVWAYIERSLSSIDYYYSAEEYTQ